jgi:uncharacterized protein YegL
MTGLAVIVIGIIGYFAADDQPPQPTHLSPENLRAALSVPAANVQKDGIALALLVDTSGSMAESVPSGGAGGGYQPKINIARNAATRVVSLMEKYAGEKKASGDVQLGIWEFSGRSGSFARNLVPMDAPSSSAAQSPIRDMTAQGNTPIGSAMIEAKKALDATGLKRRYMLVITDGENTAGQRPEEVVGVMSGLPEAERANVYFIAFDVEAQKFNFIKDNGGMVLSAANEKDLQTALDFILTGQILLE